MNIDARSIIDAPQLRSAAEQLRPDADPGEVVARAAWSVLLEPGDGVAGALIAVHGAVAALQLALGEPGLLVPEEISPRALADARSRWHPRAKAEAVKEALSSCREVGGQILLPDDEDWPRGLDDLGAHAPQVLWARGDPGVLHEGATASIVGARAATGYGESVAAEIAGDLASSGTTIISGGAYGIDGAAHRAALGSGGKTAAFLAGGVDRAYPIGHQQLFDRIRASGVVMSEVPCGGAPTKWRFLQRNRLIAASGMATVVVEAGWRSGSLNTAGHAAALGRPIGAVPGPVTSAASAGCHRLLREYDAVCVTNAQEVRELWGEQPDPASAAVRADPEQIRLLDALSSRAPRETAELARRSGLAMDRVRSLLGLLALDGAVTQHERGWQRTP
ncbi:Rossmann fold nucleotide-binding protein Smf possibly involved in DNA uptake [Microbacterium esteraromaticum]|uniref:Rossmann fold nucleotide-binding protein Smf possibly involved in DNA uptake n=1 Tax=Microbacterium esteraromaticum TaxID=57043 RepID=A0A1R4IDR8_9MICO|nr:DNA-processing protein DprA [Microbacterium esteraromaticum]SJN17938.1 Rossmann fold nucleotide-binding protein Smf possibly involved in DNA uptake [Microbacterium esteraromaticum]